jgi:SAM-dependent methyltransferase
MSQGTPAETGGRTSPTGELQLVRELVLDDAALVRAVASGRRRNTTVPFRRVEARYVDVRAGRRLQITAYDDTQARIRNVDLGSTAERAVDDLLQQPFANWHVETTTETVQLRVTKRGRVLVHRQPSTGSSDRPDRSHDRAKQHRLPESDKLFHLLGLATADGVVKPSRRAKFRQVQDFLAVLDPVVDTAVTLASQEPPSQDRPLRLVDLGCGNAYLTFAAFHYLSAVKHLPVQAVGVDRKSSARAHNVDLAQRLGIADSFRFVDAAIGDVELDQRPDVVVALHACDTATDDALARAVRWQAPVVLVAPCCHHDLQRQLADRPTPMPFQLLTKHAILRERFADVLTDALRAAVLRMVGYRVDVVEFVDSEHTPRNSLIRAVRTGAPADPATVASYERLVREWQVRPALATRLAADHPGLVPSLHAADSGSPPGD